MAEDTSARVCVCDEREREDRASRADSWAKERELCSELGLLWTKRRERGMRGCVCVW